MIKSVADIDKASNAVIRAYLKAENVSFSEDAGRDELIADARQHLTTKQGKDPAPKKVKQEEVPDDTSSEDALRMLQSKGFDSREEVIAFLNVIEREKQTVASDRAALQEKVEAIELAELQMADREKALVTKSDEVRADMQKQEALYEKLEALKNSFPAGTDLTV